MNIPVLIRCRKREIGTWNSDFDDHVLQTGGVFVDDLPFVLANDDGIGVAHPAPVRIVNSRFATEDHAFLQHGFVALGDPWRLMPLQTNTVSCPVFEKVLKTCLANLV